ncbi:MAG: bifunctional glutamate N-acetyltransferase/amino-acid acetyltransferase ArgJ [Enterococcus sp.]
MTLPLPKGFFLDAVRAGIKSKGLDFGFILSERMCNAAGVFTTNQSKAAPVKLSQQVLANQQLQGILVNSGNANAATGKQGMQDAKQLQEVFAKRAQIPVDLVAVASTGAIGPHLPMEKMLPMIEQFTLTNHSIDNFQQAIMTTDTKEKQAGRVIETANGPVTIFGVAKGSGMIHPLMGTMLCFVLTDAQIEGDLLQQWVKKSTDGSFNQVSIDGDTSTNDSVFLLANGASQSEIIEGSPDAQLFYTTLEEIMVELAKAIAGDGEGATRMLEVVVQSAPTQILARDAARKIVRSPLVKAAVYGHDPNWGRILSTLGMSEIAIDLEKIIIQIGPVIVYLHGEAQEYNEEILTQYFEEETIRFTIDLASGEATGTAWGCDLTEKYVELNAHYHT